ncbi:MAG: hypothetical protein PHE33_05065 [Bacteroidales bacterium]|nr:hypothetical protein [Bacteroidales bacterium]
MGEKQQIILYQSSEGIIKLDVHLHDETVWLSQEQMAQLFAKGRSTIAKHISNVYEEKELEQSSTCRKSRQVRLEGKRVTNNMGHLTEIKCVEKPVTECLSKMGGRNILLNIAATVTKII